MTKSLERTAQRRKLLGEIERLAEIGHLWNALGNLPHLRTSGLSLSGRWTQAWSASECELPRGEGQDHWLLCSQWSGGGHARRSGRLAKNAAMFARTSGVK